MSISRDSGRVPAPCAERSSTYCRSALISRGTLAPHYWSSRWNQDARMLIPGNRSEQVIPHFQFTDVASVDSRQLRYGKIPIFPHEVPSYTLQRPMISDHEDGFGGSVRALEIRKEAVERVEINILVRLPVRSWPYTTPIPIEESARAKTADHFNIGEAFPVTIIYLAKPPIGDGKPPCTRGVQSDLCIAACSSQRTAKCSGWYAPCIPKCGPESPCLTFPLQDEGGIGLAS